MCDRQRAIWPMIALVCAFPAMRPAAAQRAHPLRGYPACSEFIQLVGRELTSKEHARLWEMLPYDRGTTLAEIAEALEPAGIKVVVTEADADKLLPLRGPKIARLRDPDEFAAVGLSNETQVQIINEGSGVISPMERGEFERRYTGNALTVPQEAAPGPRVEMTQFYCVGQVTRVDEPITHEVLIKNVGAEPLEVKVHRPVCRGTASLKDRSPIAPGQTGAVMVALEPGRVEEYGCRIVLGTNDPLTPRIHVTFRTQVPHDLEIGPDSLIFRLEKGQADSRTINLKAPMNVTLDQVSSDLDWLAITATREPDAEYQRVWSIEVVVPSTAPVGSYETEIAVETQGKDRATLWVPVEITIESDLLVRPPSAFFGFVKPGEKAEKTVTISSRSGAKFSVLEVAVEGEAIAAGAAVAGNEGWSIPVTVTAEEVGVIEGKLVVTTDSPGEERIEIPVYAHVMQR